MGCIRVHTASSCLCVRAFVCPPCAKVRSDTPKQRCFCQMYVSYLASFLCHCRRRPSWSKTRLRVRTRVASHPMDRRHEDLSDSCLKVTMVTLSGPPSEARTSVIACASHDLELAGSTLFTTRQSAHQLRETTTRVQQARCSNDSNVHRKILSLQGERFPRGRGEEQMFGRATHLPYGPELNERPWRCWVVQHPCWSVLHCQPHEIWRKNRKNTLSRTPRTR